MIRVRKEEGKIRNFQVHICIVDNVVENHCPLVGQDNIQYTV